MTVFIGYLWTVRQTGTNRIYPFSNKKGYVWTEHVVFIVFTLSCSLPDSHHTTNNKRPNPTVGTGEEQNDVH